MAKCDGIYASLSINELKHRNSRHCADEISKCIFNDIKLVFQTRFYRKIHSNAFLMIKLVFQTRFYRKIHWNLFGPGLVQAITWTNDDAVFIQGSFCVSAQPTGETTSLRRHYIATSSLIGWAHTQSDSCLYITNDSLIYWCIYASMVWINRNIFLYNAFKNALHMPTCPHVKRNQLLQMYTSLWQMYQYFNKSIQ